MDTQHIVRRPTARLAWEEARSLRIGFLRQYARDPLFTDELSTLWEKHGAIVAALPWFTQWWHIHFVYPVPFSDATQAYAKELHALAARFGLDAFRQTDGPLAYYGCEAIHQWCIAMTEGTEHGPGDFGLFLDFFGDAAPEVGDVVSRQVWAVPVRKAAVRTVEIIEEHREPRLRVLTGERWYADEERRSDAKARLVAGQTRQDAALIDADLARLERDFRAAGYIFGNGKPMLQTHLRWLFRRIAFRLSCDAIAAEEGAEGDPDADDSGWYSETAVRNATQPLAKQIGITIPRPRRAPEK